MSDPTNGTPDAETTLFRERARHLLETMGLTETELESATASGLLLPLASLGHQVVELIGRVEAMEKYLKAKIMAERRGGNARIINPFEKN